MKLLRTKSSAKAANPIQGRRLMLIGQTLAPLAHGPLTGASVEIGGTADLARLAMGGVDLVLIDADAWDAPALATGVKTLTGLKSCPPVLMIGERLPAGLVRNLLQLPAADILESPYTDEQLLEAIQPLLAASAAMLAPTMAPGESRCWAVSGAVGGSGATTVAVEIAYALSNRNDARGVCLVDLNLADGAAAAYLGAAPAMRLAEFGQAADRLDAAMLRAFVTPVSKNLDLLAGMRDPAAFDTVEREAVLRILDIACDSYDWVVLDLPRHRRPWTLEAIAGCDEVMVVSELTVPALLAARAYSDEIETTLNRRPRIVLNRVSSRMFGPAPSLTEAEKALQRKAEAGISSDWEAAAASVNLGGPIAQHRPKSKIVKDIQTVVERLAAQPSRRDAEAA